MLARYNRLLAVKLAPSPARQALAFRGSPGSNALHRICAPPRAAMAFSTRPPLRSIVVLRRRRAAAGDREPSGEQGVSSSGGAMAAGGVVGTLMLLGGKAKFVLAALKFTKLPTVLSMLASSGAYTFIYGWPFAVTMMGHLVVHESGHALMMRHYGYPFTPMVFIPFMGAVVGQTEPSRNATEEGNIALAGPLAGGALSLALSAGGMATGSQFMLAAAEFGFMINLFNLIPALPLDGGRAASVLSPWAVAAGSAGMLGLVATGAIQSSLGYMIALFSVYGTYQRFFGDYESFHESTTRREKFRIGASYVSLVAVLLVGMAYNARRKKSPAQLRRELGQAPQSAMERQLLDFSAEHGEDQRSSLESDDPWLSSRRRTSA